MAVVSALVAVSLLAGAVQDIKENQVSDYTWIPAILGATLMIYFNMNNYLFLALKLFMTVTILIVGYFFGGGVADIIGLAAAVVDDDPFSPVGTMIIFLIVTTPYAVFKKLVRKERKQIMPLKEFVKRKNIYPVKLFVDGKETKLPKTVDKAYEVFEALLEQGKEAYVEAETGVPAIVPMCVGYVLNMMIIFYLGEPWVMTLLNSINR
ncbi:MAG: hypothetical protein ACUVQ8_02890 [Nitrososphaeria archaeon]